MEKDYYTNKEIIFGLRNDFIKRNRILLEIKKALVPLKKNINIDVHYDNLSQTIDLDANYNTTYFINLIKKACCHKYVYEAIIQNNKKSHIIELFENSDSPKRIFPIDFDIATFCKLDRLFQELISSEYDITNSSENIFSLYNCLVLLEQKKGLKSNMISYNPVGDLLSIYSDDDDMNNYTLQEFLKRKHSKDLFTKKTRYTIEHNESSLKPVTIIDDFDDMKEADFGIRERNDKIILVKKLKR